MIRYEYSIIPYPDKPFYAIIDCYRKGSNLYFYTGIPILIGGDVESIIIGQKFETDIRGIHSLIITTIKQFKLILNDFAHGNYGENRMWAETKSVWIYVVGKDKKFFNNRIVNLGVVDFIEKYKNDDTIIVAGLND